jgi:hypothetical protein
MYREEHIVDLHKRTDFGTRMTAMIFSMDFTRREEKDVVDGVKGETQNLLLVGLGNDLH